MAEGNNMEQMLTLLNNLNTEMWEQETRIQQLTLKVQDLTQEKDETPHNKEEPYNEEIPKIRKEENKRRKFLNQIHTQIGLSTY